MGESNWGGDKQEGGVVAEWLKTVGWRYLDTKSYMYCEDTLLNVTVAVTWHGLHFRKELQSPVWHDEKVCFQPVCVPNPHMFLSLFDQWGWFWFFAHTAVTIVSEDRLILIISAAIEIWEFAYWQLKITT